MVTTTYLPLTATSMMLQAIRAYLDLHMARAAIIVQVCYSDDLLLCLIHVARVGENVCICMHVTIESRPT